jgi:hypothetical protein
LVISAMIAAGSMQSAGHQSPVAQTAISLPQTRIAESSNEEININIAKIAGRAAFQPPSQAPLTREELLSILLLMSQRPQGAGARS